MAIAPSLPYWKVNLTFNISSGNYYDSSYSKIRIPYSLLTVDDCVNNCIITGNCEYVIPPLESSNEQIDYIDFNCNDRDDDGLWHYTRNKKYQYRVTFNFDNRPNYCDVTVTIELRVDENSDIEVRTLRTTAIKKHTLMRIRPDTIGTIYLDEGQTFVLTKNDYTATVDGTIVTQDTVMSKSVFTRADVIHYGGEPYNVEISYTYNEDYPQTISKLLTLYLTTKMPISAVVNGQDTVQRYYGNEQSYFVEPVFNFSDVTKLYTITYNDGTTADVSASDIESIEYTLTNDFDAEPLVENESIIEPTVSTLYVHLILTNGDEAFAPYSIYRKADTVSSVTANVSFDFVLGNKLEKYKGNDFVVTAIWENPLKPATTNFVDYSFAYTSIVMTSSDLGSSTNILIGNRLFAIDLSDMDYINPTIDKVVIKEAKGIKTSYQNDVERINLTDVVLTISYNDAEYTSDVVFSNSNTVDNEHYSVRIYNDSTQILNNVDYINGEDVLDLNDGEKIYNCTFDFVVKNIFDDSTMLSALIVPFTISSIKEVVGIKIISAYKNYKVGETFLNENDDTVVRIFFNSTDSLEADFIDSVDVYLRDDIPTISTNYAKGTEWTQSDASKRIVVSSVFNSNISAEYTISVVYDGYVAGSNTKNLVVVWKSFILRSFILQLEGFETITEENGLLGIYNEEDTYIDSNGIRQLFNPLKEPLGYIRNIFNTKTLNSQAVMVLFDDYIPPIEGAANITIEYPCYDGLADNINKCTFGILFGNNNANNRLFVSGNPNVRNADWHSAETNAIHTEGEVENFNGDFSYFPNQNIMYYGETDNKVIGYDIVANDKLLVLKDKSDKEKTVYFRTPTLVTALDATGATVTDVQGNALYQEEFALVKGNNSVAGVSPHSIVNLNGDTLFIDSNNTVEGLDLTGIVGDNQRYANSRSMYLDKALEALDLSETFLWTNNKYLFMPVKDEGLFVTHVDAFNSETRQYDWWKLQSENPSCFAEIDNVVYFGNKNGELFRMRNGKFEDEFKVFVNEGQGILARINEEEYPKVIDGIEIPAESIVVNDDIFDQLFPDGIIDESRRLLFHSVNNGNTYKGSMFHQIASISSNEEDDVDIHIVEEDGVYYLELSNNIERQTRLVSLLKENTEYYLNYYKEEGEQRVKCNPNSRFYNNYNNRFRLVYVPTYENDRYLMKIYNDVTQEWDDIDLVDLYKANLVEKLDGEYQLFDISAETNSFRLKDENGEAMNIVSYGNQGATNTFSAEIIEKKNVTAYYIVAPLTMGDINHFKTIWSMTLTNDSGEPSEYDLAVASNKIPMFNTKNISSVSKAKIGTNFADFIFNAVDFDKNVVPRTYTIQRTMGMQKFVCLAFKNDNNTDAILSSLSVTYTIPFPSYGSD